MQIQVRRVRVISDRPFEEVVARLLSTIGRPDIEAFREALAAAATASELTAVVEGAIGPSDLMEFVHFDAGHVLRMLDGTQHMHSLRLLIGNPLLMAEMARSAPDAAAYAPVTILVDQRVDGVHLSYDSMASLLAPYAPPEALRVAERLDLKIEELLEFAAGRPGTEHADAVDAARLVSTGAGHNHRNRITGRARAGMANVPCRRR